MLLDVLCSFANVSKYFVSGSWEDAIIPYIKEKLVRVNGKMTWELICKYLGRCSEKTITFVKVNILFYNRERVDMIYVLQRH